jgi:hypothetical protein
VGRRNSPRMSRSLSDLIRRVTCGGNFPRMLPGPIPSGRLHRRGGIGTIVPAARFAGEVQSAGPPVLPWMMAAFFRQEPRRPKERALRARGSASRPWV